MRLLQIIHLKDLPSKFCLTNVIFYSICVHLSLLTKFNPSIHKKTRLIKKNFATF